MVIGLFDKYNIILCPRLIFDEIIRQNQSAANSVDVTENVNIVRTGIALNAKKHNIYVEAKK